jgi:ubiquitin-protein ligase
MPLTEKGLKRVLKELKEYESGDKKAFTLAYDENNLQVFYAIVRSMDGPYEGGEYVLKIKLPDDYPFKPPVISCDTPNGRFHAATNICLNISHYHSESWSPLITLEKIIYSVLSVFYDPSINGIGSHDTSDGEKRVLAAQSKEYNRKHYSKILEMERS